MLCESQFSGVIIAVEMGSLIGLSGQKDSLPSLHLTFWEQTVRNTVATGVLSQHLLKNVWYSESGMPGFATVTDNKLVLSFNKTIAKKFYRH